MTEQKDDEELDNPINSQPENTPSEPTSTPAPQEEPDSSAQEIETMEVHHHAHDPLAPHHKKTWKSYIWEFLMLFLAVFCGFMAEYFLEHRIEKERGIQYVHSMIEDMASDSTKINLSLEFCKRQKAGIDSLAQVIGEYNSLNREAKNAYLLMSKYTMVIGNVLFTKRTITQLRNSGGMRLLPNKKSADEITKYSEWVESAEYQGNYLSETALNEVINSNKKIFYFTKIESIKNEIKGINIPLNSFELANQDKLVLLEYQNNLIILSEVLSTYMSMIDKIKSKIPEIIESLKQENNLD